MAALSDRLYFFAEAAPLEPHRLRLASRSSAPRGAGGIRRCDDGPATPNLQNLRAPEA